MDTKRLIVGCLTSSGNFRTRTCSTIYKIYTEMWEEWENRDNEFCMPLKKYSE